MMLQTEKTILRPPTDDDLPRLTDWRNDIALQVSLLAVPRPNSAERVRAWLARRLEDEQAVFFIVADRQTNLAIGFVQAVNLDFVHGRGELGICLCPQAQGKGFAAEALSLLERYLVDRFRLRKLTLFVLANNERAMRFYSRQEFTQSGVLREHFFADGAYHDVLVMEKFLPHCEAV
jgi:RimJ/RimL family protein N-acetyltransferase